MCLREWRSYAVELAHCAPPPTPPRTISKYKPIFYQVVSLSRCSVYKVQLSTNSANKILRHVNSTVQNNSTVRNLQPKFSNSFSTSVGYDNVCATVRVIQNLSIIFINSPNGMHLRGHCKTKDCKL